MHGSKKNRTSNVHLAWPIVKHRKGKLRKAENERFPSVCFFTSHTELFPGLSHSQVSTPSVIAIFPALPVRLIDGG